MTQGVLLDMQLESIVGNNKVEIYAYIFIHELGLRGQALYNKHHRMNHT